MNNKVQNAFKIIEDEIVNYLKFNGKSQFQNVWGNTTSAHQSRAMFFEN
jgi:hypothetical protein